jgi:hypothetical protein
LAVGAGIALIAVVFFIILPSIADPRDVWATVRHLSWLWFMALAGAAAINVVTFAPQYMAALPGLRFRPALAMTTASNASTYIAPGGIAVGIGLSYAMLRGWGFRAREVTLSITVVTIWNQFMVFGTPAIRTRLALGVRRNERAVADGGVCGRGRVRCDRGRVHTSVEHGKARRRGR